MNENVKMLDRSHLEVVVEILKDAFYTDPLFHYVFSPSSNEYVDCLRELFRFSCEVRFLLEWPLFGYLDDNDKIVGALGVSMPGEVTWPQSLTDIYAQMKDFIGVEATMRFETMVTIAEPLRPPQPYFELGVLGVAPNEHGKGYGGELVGAMNQLADEHPDIPGVYVETQNSQNVTFYNRSGYETRGKMGLFEKDDLNMWGLFRPNPQKMKE